MNYFSLFSNSNLGTREAVLKYLWTVVRLDNLLHCSSLHLDPRESRTFNSNSLFVRLLSCMDMLISSQLLASSPWIFHITCPWNCSSILVFWYSPNTCAVSNVCSGCRPRRSQGIGSADFFFHLFFLFYQTSSPKAMLSNTKCLLLWLRNYRDFF